MVKVNVLGDKALKRLLERLPAHLSKEVLDEVKFSSEHFRELAIKDAPADVGFLRAQITVNKAGDMAYEVVSGSKYSAAMEFGTKTRFVPIQGIDSSEFKGQPTGGTWKEFVENIKRWVKRKGLAAITNSYTGKTRTKKKDIDTVAYAVATSIYKKGVRPHPFFFKQIAPVRQEFFKNVRNVIKELL